MTEDQFRNEIGRLVIAFGDNVFDSQRLHLIRLWIKFESFPHLDFIRIVDGFIANRKKSDPPLPQAFRDAAGRIQRHKHQESGPYIPDCQKCLDVGVLRVDHEPSLNLALCDCDHGFKQPWKLPRNGADIVRKHAPLPPQEFKPNFTVNGQNLQKAIRERVAWWREKVRHAEDCWKSRASASP